MASLCGVQISHLYNFQHGIWLQSAHKEMLDIIIDQKATFAP